MNVYKNEGREIGCFYIYGYKNLLVCLSVFDEFLFSNEFLRKFCQKMHSVTLNSLWLELLVVCWLIIPPTPRRGRGVYCFTSVRLSVQDIFRCIFLSNCWWQKSNIWSQSSYRYTILWVAFLDLSDSYFLFADLVGFL